MRINSNLVKYLAASASPVARAETDFGILRAKEPVEFVSDIYGIGLMLIGGVALLAIVYGGYVILSSQGDPSKIRDGKAYIFYALIGLFMAFAGMAVYQIIGGDVLKIPGFR